MFILSESCYSYRGLLNDVDIPKGGYFNVIGGRENADEEEGRRSL